ncbi:MAG: hypothetical protein JRJ65_16255, partial [Deltaproteobacteria bacterium]|nr:hypothetical protein [Deltaproteobacteria bacterium]
QINIGQIGVRNQVDRGDNTAKLDAAVCCAGQIVGNDSNLQHDDLIHFVRQLKIKGIACQRKITR